MAYPILCLPVYCTFNLRTKVVWASSSIATVATKIACIWLTLHVVASTIKTFTKKQAKLFCLAGLKLHPYILKHIMYVCSPVEQCFSLFSRTNSIELDILLRHGQSSTTGAHSFRLLTFWLANRLYTLHQFVFIHQGKQIIGLSDYKGLDYPTTIPYLWTNQTTIV